MGGLSDDASIISTRNTGENIALAGIAFKGVFDVAAVAAVQAFVKLRNPANSGVNGILKRGRSFSTVGAGRVAWLSSKDATDYGAIPTGPFNAFLGGPASALKMTQGNNANGGDAAMLGLFGDDSLSAGMNIVIPYVDFEVIVPPGFAIILNASNVNVDIHGTLEWIERAI